jgi:hypothetical protein
MGNMQEFEALMIVSQSRRSSATVPVLDIFSYQDPQSTDLEMVTTGYDAGV